VATTNQRSDDSFRASVDADRKPQTEFDVLGRAISHRARIHTDAATDIERAFFQLRAKG
jgi:hypothetical protein